MWCLLWSQTVIYILYIMHFLAAEIFVCFSLLSCIYYRSRTVSFLEQVLSNIHWCGYRVVWKLKILIDYPCLDVFHRVLGKLFSSPCLNTFRTNLSQYLWLRRNLLSFWVERSLDLCCGHLLIVAAGQERNLESFFIGCLFLIAEGGGWEQEGKPSLFYRQSEHLSSWTVSQLLSFRHSQCF